MTTLGQHDLPLGRLEGWMHGHIDGFRGPLAAASCAADVCVADTCAARNSVLS